MAYNLINTKGTKTDIAGTDTMRESVFNSAGIPEFYGVSIMEINEMGIGQKYNDLFDTVKGSAITFDKATQELVMGLDLSKESMLRAVATDSETGSEFDLVVDDQFVTRSQKVGYYGSLEEGRMLLDDRVLTGIIV